MTTQSLPLTIAAAGRTLLAAKIAAGESLVIDRIKLGVGRYTPTGLGDRYINSLHACT